MANKVAAVSNSLYVLAGIALFATGEAPVITPTTDFLGDKFAMAWAGWKFSGCLYFALINFGVPVLLSNAVTMIPYIAFDIIICCSRLGALDSARAGIYCCGGDHPCAVFDGTFLCDPPRHGRPRRAEGEVNFNYC